MSKKITAILLAVLIVFSFSLNTIAADETQPNQSTQTETPPKRVITDFSGPRKVLSDPSFNLSSVEQEVLEAWYSQIVVIPDATLKKAVKSAAGVSSDSDVTVADMLGLIGTLDLGGLGITSLVGLEYAINVNKLIISNNKLTSLESLANLYKLESLDYSNNQIKVVPSWIFASESLAYVNGNNNNSTVVTASDVDSVLEELYLEGNKLTTLPDLWCLKRIQVLSLANNNFEEFPATVLNMTTLRSFSMSKNSLTSVPDLSSLVSLKTLNLNNNAIEYFPEGINNMPALKQLDLNGNAIKEVPDLIANAPIGVLNLSQNELTVLPAALSQMSELTVLDIGVNYIDLKNEENTALIETLTGRLETFHYKIQIPQFSFNMNEFEEYPAGKLTWEGITDITDETEGSLVITKFVLERIEETISNDDTEKNVEKNTDETETESSDAGETPGGTKPTINVYKEIAVLDSTVREYVDETASPGKNYTYRLTAFATCNYLGEASFEINIVKKVNTAEMIMNTPDREQIIRYILIGLAIFLIIGVTVYTATKKSRRKNRKRRKTKIRKAAVKSTANDAQHNKRKDRPVKRKSADKSNVEKISDKTTIKKNYTENFFDDDVSSNKAYLEEKIENYLKSEFPEDWKEK